MAPFYANVDIRGTGEVFYRVRSNNHVMGQVDELIRSLCQYEMGYRSSNIIVATWSQVGHWNRGTSKVSYLMYNSYTSAATIIVCHMM